VNGSSNLWQPNTLYESLRQKGTRVCAPIYHDGPCPRVLVADDPSLPKPRGRTDHKRPVDKQETHKLEATKKLGGLIPDRTGEQYWQCAECSAIYDNCMQAKACCGSEANRVQICQNCRKRIADCTCPSPMGQQQINGGWVKDSSLEREIICISLRSAIDDFWWQRTEGVPAVILGGQERSR